MEDEGFMAEGLRAGRGMEASAEAAFQVEALRTERLLCSTGLYYVYESLW